MRGEEIMSGAQRVHDPAYLTERAKLHGIGNLIRQNKKISVFWVTGPEILGRVGTDLFYFLFFWKKYKFMHFERQNCLSKCIKLYFFLKT